MVYISLVLDVCRFIFFFLEDIVIFFLKRCYNVLVEVIVLFGIFIIIVYVNIGNFKWLFCYYIIFVNGKCVRVKICIWFDMDLEIGNVEILFDFFV